MQMVRGNIRALALGAYYALADTRIQTSAFVPKISSTKHNVFGIQTGVAVLFLVEAKEEMG